MHRFYWCLVLVLCSCSVVRNRIESAPGAQTAGNTSAGAIDRQLLETAQSIEKSLQTLAAAQELKNPPLLNTAPLVSPEGGMGGTADIDWAGPIAPLVNKIAVLSHYRLKTLGNEPALPIIITINARQAVLADILQNAAHQAGKRASVMVFPETKVIELRYQNP